jgi:membrane protease YdiL (CAAX protease family)
LIFGAYLLASLLVTITSSLLTNVGLARDNAPVLAEVVLTAVNFLGLLIGGLWYLDWRDGWSLIGVRRPTRRDLGTIVSGSVVLVVLMVVAEIVLGQLGLEPAENAAVETGKQHPELFLYYIPVVLLLNAPAEELLFRGIVQGLFRRAYGIVLGIISASLVFGLIHYAALIGGGSPHTYVFLAVLSGGILGALYEFSGNLLVPIIVHAVWNILVYLNLYAGTV